MSYTRMFCALSARTKAVAKYSAIGGLTGAAAGAAIGGLAVGFVYDHVSEKCLDNIVATHGCVIKKHYHDGGPSIEITCDGESQVAVIYEEAVACRKKASNASEQVVTQALSIATVGGFVMGFFAGAVYGWKKRLALSEDLLKEPLHLISSV